MQGLSRVEKVEETRLFVDMVESILIEVDVCCEVRKRGRSWNCNCSSLTYLQHSRSGKSRTNGGED